MGGTPRLKRLLTLAAVAALAVVLGSPGARATTPGDAGDRGAPGAPSVGRVVVVMDGFENTTGQALVALYDSEDAWLKIDRARRVIRAPVTGTRLEVTFDAVPFGTYGVAVIHDRNKNGKLDMRYFPIPGPEEGAGCSRDAHATFGPPSFKDAVFTLEGAEVRIPVKIRY